MKDLCYLCKITCLHLGCVDFRIKPGHNASNLTVIAMPEHAFFFHASYYKNSYAINRIRNALYNHSLLQHDIDVEVTESFIRNNILQAGKWMVWPFFDKKQFRQVNLMPLSPVVKLLSSP